MHTNNIDQYIQKQVRGSNRFVGATAQSLPFAKILKKSMPQVYIFKKKLFFQVGGSGNGKSTVAGLLLRFYDVADGVYMYVYMCIYVYVYMNFYIYLYVCVCVCVLP